ncbi:unnamed protein product [Echinostoma caproni]|uniref:RING-type domain-containing protein n=1 Tax=Echinostoma caproni TaxID=27848 RepID=A0A183AED2_9TREM|nr:unnamed protein product [Echinostoma caproni]
MLFAPVFTLRWRQLASSINAEYRSPDKFVSGQGGIGHNWPGRRFIVTTSWILASRFTKFTVIRQHSDELVALLISSASVPDPDSRTEGGRPAGENLGTQMVVTLRFVDVQTASNLDVLRSTLQCPLIKAPGVDLEPTVVQRFVQAFAEVVDEGDPVSPDHDMDLEQCIGCMAQTANVTLIQRCAPDQTMNPNYGRSTSPGHQEARCGTCRCRPMWCLDCMARWFASRQTEAHRSPDVWLSGRVPCPTCRAVFLFCRHAPMGAEQSNPVNDPSSSLSSSLRNVTTAEPPGSSSSLPPSPQHSSLPVSHRLSRESSKSVTMSNFKTPRDHVSSIPPLTSPESTNRMIWTHSGSTTSLTSHSRQHSPSLGKLNRSSGIVVVCPGPIRRMRSTGSLDSVAHAYNKTDAGSAELRRLRQIPAFEPLIAQSVGSLEDTLTGNLVTSSSGRHLDVSLHRVAPDGLVAFAKRYGEYVQSCAQTAYQQQTLILGLQNKVDYETRHVWSALQARENGTTLTSPTLLSPKVGSNFSPLEAGISSPPTATDLTYAGRQQVDAVVLQTSQISGLIDQCTTMVQRLRDTISEVNRQLNTKIVPGESVLQESGDL